MNTDYVRENCMKFMNTCTDGNLELAQQIFQINSNINIFWFEESFACACSNGHLKVAQWLLQINPNINISNNDDSAFRYVCGGLICCNCCYRERRSRLCCHLEVVLWLIKLRPDKYKKQFFINEENLLTPIISNAKEQLWYKIQYLIDLNTIRQKKTHPLYQLPNDIIWLMTFYI